MKISADTIEILKNFAQFNQNIFVKAGNTLSTITQGKNLFANATVAESFPVDFGIYNLNEFLGVLSLFASPDLDFANSGYVVVSNEGGGSESVRYVFADPAVLVYPQKQIVMPNVDVELPMSEDVFARLSKISRVLSVGDLVLESNGTDTWAVVKNKKVENSNESKYSFGKEHVNGKEFKVLYKIENLNFLPGNYTVEISKKNISRFVNQKRDLVYFVANETGSTYGF